MEEDGEEEEEKENMMRRRRRTRPSLTQDLSAHLGGAAAGIGGGGEVLRNHKQIL